LLVLIFLPKKWK